MPVVERSEPASRLIAGWCKCLVRRLLALLFRGRSNIPVFAGPARGRVVPRDIGLETLAVLFGRYEQATALAIAAMPPSVRVAYDVGAHVGLTTLLLAGRAPACRRVIAFEPARENAARLRALIGANPGMDATVFELAVSDRSGAKVLYCFGASAMGMLEQVAASNERAPGEAARSIVQAVSLDDFVFDQGHPPPDLVKIDVEGAEALVVAGALRVIDRYRPILLIELHGPLHAEEVWKLLAPPRYRWRFVHPKRGPAEGIDDAGQLHRYFGPDERWTQHVVLS